MTVLRRYKYPARKPDGFSLGTRMNALAIAIGPDGSPWIVTGDHVLYRRTDAGWQVLPGRVSDVAVGAEGSVWALGPTYEPTDGGQRIMCWRGGSWATVEGGAVRIAVDPQGRPWVVNCRNELFCWTDHDGWRQLPGDGTDIAVGPDGSVWLIGPPYRPTDGGQLIFRWTGSEWEAVVGGAVRIAVGPEGRPWVVNSRNEVFCWLGHDWEQLPGRAVDIAVGPEGSVWVIGTRDAGDPILYWDQSNWIRVDDDLSNGAREDAGQALVPRPGNESYRRADVQGREITGTDGSSWPVAEGGYHVSLGQLGEIDVRQQGSKGVTININLTLNRTKGNAKG
jgi:hypothetical protein